MQTLIVKIVTEWNTFNSFGLWDYLIILVSDSGGIPNQHLDESWAFISDVDAVHLLLLLELSEGKRQQ